MAKTMEDALPTPAQILSTKRGADFYVDSASMCKTHGYYGQGWPKAADCKHCELVWRVVHINPGTERAGL